MWKRFSEPIQRTTPRTTCRCVLHYLRLEASSAIYIQAVEVCAVILGETVLELTA